VDIEFRLKTLETSLDLHPQRNHLGPKRFFRLSNPAIAAKQQNGERDDDCQS